MDRETMTVCFLVKVGTADTETGPWLSHHRGQDPRPVKALCPLVGRVYLRIPRSEPSVGTTENFVQAREICSFIPNTDPHARPHVPHIPCPLLEKKCSLIPTFIYSLVIKNYYFS